MNQLEKALGELERDYRWSTEAVRRVYDLFPDDSLHFSPSPITRSVHIHVSGGRDFLPSLRKARRVFGKIIDRSIYPTDGKQARVSFDFRIDEGLRVSLGATTEDYTRLLRQGAMCKVVAQSKLVVCQ